MYLNPHQRLTAVLALGILLAAGDCFAQERMRTVQISEGSVMIDGTPVPTAQLPANFNASGTMMNLQFSESSRPIFELNGALFTLEDRRIVPFVGAHNAFGLPAAEAERALRAENVGELHRRLASIETARAQASGRDLRRLTRERELLLTQINQVARQASRIAYVHSIQDENKALYTRMAREAQMEAEARALVHRIANLPAGEDRSRLASELREKLSEIFEIKQQNRQDEIDELTARLSELRSRLSEREQHKEEIIERRMNDLLGRRSQHDW